MPEFAGFEVVDKELWKSWVEKIRIMDMGGRFLIVTKVYLFAPA